MNAEALVGPGLRSFRVWFGLLLYLSSANVLPRTRLSGVGTKGFPRVSMKTLGYPHVPKGTHGGRQLIGCLVGEWFMIGGRQLSVGNWFAPCGFWSWFPHWNMAFDPKIGCQFCLCPSRSKKTTSKQHFGITNSKGWKQKPKILKLDIAFRPPQSRVLPSRICIWAQLFCAFGPALRTRIRVVGKIWVCFRDGLYGPPG